MGWSRCSDYSRKLIYNIISIKLQRLWFGNILYIVFHLWLNNKLIWKVNSFNAVQKENPSIEKIFHFKIYTVIQTNFRFVVNSLFIVENLFMRFSQSTFMSPIIFLLNVKNDFFDVFRTLSFFHGMLTLLWSLEYDWSTFIFSFIFSFGLIPIS